MPEEATQPEDDNDSNAGEHGVNPHAEEEESEPECLRVERESWGMTEEQVQGFTYDGMTGYEAAECGRTLSLGSD